ncbi:MAG: DUF1735 domain-containing protein [Parafilimonas sp.]
MKKYIIQFIFIGAVICFIITGCLKDDAFDNGSIQSVHTTGALIKPIEIKLTANDASNFFILAVNNSDNDTTVDLVPVNLATSDPAPQDLHVTLALDSNLVLVFDTTGTAAGTPGGDYAVPPSSMYQIVNPVVTIPKGSHTGYLQIKFKISDFLGADWALGFKIASIQETGYTISGNLNSGVTAIVIKNPYDGYYTGYGYFVHPSVGGSFSATVSLFTSGPASVDMVSGQPYGSGTFGVYPRLTVGASIGNGVYAVSVTDPTGSLPSFTAPVETGYINRYDANTKTFYVNYGYTTSAPREAFDTLVFKNPR